MLNRADVVLIKVVNAKGELSQGTGFLIAPNTLVTALHVVAEQENSRTTTDDSGLPVPLGKITCTYYTESRSSWSEIITFVPGKENHSVIADWALLRVENCVGVPTLNTMPAGKESHQKCCAFGFPLNSEDLNDNGKPLHGTLSGINDPFEVLSTRTNRKHEIPTHRMFFEEGREDTTASGFSGGPVCINDHVVGLIRAFEMNPDGSARGSTAFVTPIEAIPYTWTLRKPKRKVAPASIAALTAMCIVYYSMESDESDDKTVVVEHDDYCREQAIAAASEIISKNVADAYPDDCANPRHLFYRIEPQSHTDYDHGYPPTTGMCTNSPVIGWQCTENPPLTPLEYSLIRGNTWCGEGPTYAKISYANFDDDDEFEFGYRLTKHEHNQVPNREHWGIWFYDVESTSARYIICNRDPVDEMWHRVEQCVWSGDEKSSYFSTAMNEMRNKEDGGLVNKQGGDYAYAEWTASQDVRLGEHGQVRATRVHTDNLLDKFHIAGKPDDAIAHEGSWFMILKSYMPGDVKLLVKFSGSPTKCIIPKDPDEILMDFGGPAPNLKVASGHTCSAMIESEILYAWTSGDRDKWITNMFFTDNSLWFIETPNTIGRLDTATLQMRRYRMPELIETIHNHESAPMACTQEGKCFDVLEQIQIPVIPSPPTALREPGYSAWLDDGVVSWEREWATNQTRIAEFGTTHIIAPLSAWPVSLQRIDGDIHLTTINQEAVPMYSLCNIATCTSRSSVLRLHQGADDLYETDVWIGNIGGDVWHYKSGLGVPEIYWATMPDPKGHLSVREGEVVLRGADYESHVNDIDWHSFDDDKDERDAVLSFFKAFTDDESIDTKESLCDPDSAFYHGIAQFGSIHGSIDELDIAECMHELRSAFSFPHIHYVGDIPYAETVRFRPASEGDECATDAECVSHDPDQHLACGGGQCWVPDCPC